VLAPTVMKWSLWYNYHEITNYGYCGVSVMISDQAVIDPAKVAIYIRWSTEDQSDGTTLEVQTETCSAYLVSQGWSVNPDLVFIDDGYSGGSIERPAMTRLRQLVAQGEVDCVVVYKLDRLSRSVVDTVNLVCREWENRCCIKSAREPIDTTSHAGKMFFYTLVNYAEWERSVIKERTYSGKLRRAQEGKNPGMRPAFGYGLNDNGTFRVITDEAAIVERIYREYLSGKGVRVILQGLNKDGIKPRSSAAWGQSTVSRILSNPIYVGRISWGRRRTVGNHRIKHEALVVTQSSLVPAIVSVEDWESVQSVKLTRPGFGRGQGSGRSNVSDSLLTGLLKCHCGHGYTGTATHGAYRYYRCQGVHTKGSHFCDSGSVRQEVIDDLVTSSLRELYAGSEAKDRLVAGMAKQWEHQLVEAQGSLLALEKELNRLETGQQRLKRLLRDGDITVAEYRELRVDHDREASDLQQAAERAMRVERQAQSGLRGQKRLLESLRQVDLWNRLGHLERKQLLRGFISEIRLYRHVKETTIQCHIVWRWDSATAGEPKDPMVSDQSVQQFRPLPPRNLLRDTLGRFEPTQRIGGKPS